MFGVSPLFAVRKILAEGASAVLAAIGPALGTASAAFVAHHPTSGADAGAARTGCQHVGANLRPRGPGASEEAESIHPPPLVPKFSCCFPSSQKPRRIWPDLPSQMGRSLGALAISRHPSTGAVVAETGLNPLRPCTLPGHVHSSSPSHISHPWSTLPAASRLFSWPSTAWALVRA